MQKPTLNPEAPINSVSEASENNPSVRGIALLASGAGFEFASEVGTVALVACIVDAPMTRGASLLGVPVVAGGYAAAVTLSADLFIGATRGGH